MRDGHGVHSENIPGTYRPVANKDNDYLMDREAQQRGEYFSGIKGIAIQDSSLQESMGPIVDRTKERLVLGRQPASSRPGRSCARRRSRCATRASRRPASTRRTTACARPRSCCRGEDRSSSAAATRVDGRPRHAARHVGLTWPSTDPAQQLRPGGDRRRGALTASTRRSRRRGRRGWWRWTSGAAAMVRPAVAGSRGPAPGSSRCEAGVERASNGRSATSSCCSARRHRHAPGRRARPAPTSSSWSPPRTPARGAPRRSARRAARRGIMTAGLVLGDGAHERAAPPSRALRPHARVLLVTDATRATCPSC